MSEQRKYGEATTITFPLIDFSKTDFEAGVTIAAGDAKISKDEGAFANVGASDLFVDETNGQYSVAVTDTQMQAARIVIHIIDQTATKEWEDQAVIIETYGHDSAQDKRFTNVIGQKLITPAGFIERFDITSEKITRTNFPDFGVIFTDATSPTEDDFDINTLVGTKIAITADPSQYFVIIGGYFFNDAGDTTTKVFGIALDTAFGITEGGTTIVDTNWTASELPEATFGDGWTFIVANHNVTYPASNAALSMFLKETTGDSSSSIADAVWDELKAGHTTANSYGKIVPDIETDTNEIQGKLPANFIMGSSVNTDKDDEIDAILADTAVIGTPVVDIATDIASNLTAITSIQNNTRFVASIAPHYLIPDSGDPAKVYKLGINFYDTAGNMEDPDSNDIGLDLDTFDGTDKNALLFKNSAATTVLDASGFAGHLKLEKTSTGEYFCFVKIADSETENQFVYNFKLDEATITLVYNRSNNVVLENPGSVTLANNTANKTVVAEGTWNAAEGTYDAVGSHGENQNETAQDAVSILADTNELQTDWADGGRLDLILDSILEDTGTTIPGTITTLQTDVTAIKNKTNNLPEAIKKNTATTNFPFFLVQSADDVSGATGISVTAQRLIDGGTFVAMTNAAVEDSAGHYHIDLSAADTNGTFITYKFSGSGARTRLISFKTTL